MPKPAPPSPPVLPALAALAALLFLPARPALALPIDWRGAFGLDSTLFDDYRLASAGSSDLGSQAPPPGGDADAAFQTYVFRLNPVVVVNDFATLFGEFSSGYGRGGWLGDDSTRALDDGRLGSALYPHNAAAGRSLRMTRAWAEYYADTATYVLGRHGHHWGLGAVYNDGGGVWDRHATVRDGVTLRVKMGSFRLTPYWAVVSNSTLTESTRIRDYGLGLLYDNHQRGLAFGVQYGKKSSAPEETSVKAHDRNLDDGDPRNDVPLGATDVTVMDLFLRKTMGDFEVAVEAPVFSGDLGRFYGNDRPDATRYKARAVLLEASYKASNAWTLLAAGGNVGGDSGADGQFGAAYLHPNFQVANILFRYNPRAVMAPSEAHIFDSYVTNATYAKLGARYVGSRWTFGVAGIWARANETARRGEPAFNHATNRAFTALADQDADLGTEIDLNLDYVWNSEVSMGFAMGYLVAGDYHAFTNKPSAPGEAQNSMLLQIRTAIDF